jgi:hypothetical protein
MNIEAKDFVLKMTYGELWTLAFDVRRALTTILETHWVNHQQRWKENESERLRVIRDMFYALGRPDFYDEIFNEAEKIFEKFNSKRASEV